MALHKNGWKNGTNETRDEGSILRKKRQEVRRQKPQKQKRHILPMWFYSMQDDMETPYLTNWSLEQRLGGEAANVTRTWYLLQESV